MGTQSKAKRTKEIFKLQADVCKTMANPVRMEIIYTLKEGEKTVSELVEIIGFAKSNISQHLSILKGGGGVSSRRNGVNVYYSISNTKIVEACGLMREVLMEEVAERQRIIKGLKRK